jgi:hypothetical protein
MTGLTLKRAPIGPNLEDYDVLEDGVVVGRIYWRQGRQIGNGCGRAANGDIRRAAHGYEPTRGAAMAAFARSWRRKIYEGPGRRSGRPRLSTSEDAVGDRRQGAV